MPNTAIFFRNFLIFSFLLVFCTAGLGYIFIKGNKDITKTDNWLFHTYSTIAETGQLSTLMESMLASQRAFMLTHNYRYLTEYDQAKASFSEHLAHLSTLVQDNPGQVSRIAELRARYLDLTSELDGRATSVKKGRPIPEPKSVLTTVGRLRVDITRLTQAIINEETKLLNHRASESEFKKEYYYNIIVIGGIVSLILLLILNGFLLNVQSQRDEAERTLEEVEERLKLALRGSNDGIFDWDLRTNEHYWSTEYKNMLGYAEDELTASTEVFNGLLHPEDQKMVWDFYNAYITGQKSEFICVFRMRHKSGRWIWINSRGKALFDQNNSPTRFIGAHTDVSHLKEYEQKLQATIERAEKANKAKSDFLAHMSHEIRTPLTAISGIAEIFERHMDNLNEKQKQLVKTLNTSTFTLKELINDILDFSKIESGELELEEQSFVLKTLFEQVVTIMSVKANEKGLRFTFDYNTLKNTKYMGDLKRLRQILINLIGNALKFTDAGGNVSVTATKELVYDVPVLRIDVTDTGIGIPPENIDVVFERFKQGDASVSRKYGGTGLGLPISKSLATLMGGDILVSSVLGSGSTFTVMLPIKTNVEQADVVTDKTAVDRLNTKIRATLQKKSKILMVEDYEGNIVVLSYILEELGCAYDIAKTGLQALKLWHENHYDVVLMDIQMPEMDGFTATARIRQEEREKNLPHTPIIGMTAHALVGDRDKCIEAGMDAYLPKPIVESDLKMQILKYLNAGRTPVTAA